MENPTIQLPYNDHDLLIKIVEKLNYIIISQDDDKKELEAVRTIVEKHSHWISSREVMIKLLWAGSGFLAGGMFWIVFNLFATKIIRMP
jgi:hypothetical protein